MYIWGTYVKKAVLKYLRKHRQYIFVASKTLPLAFNQMTSSQVFSCEFCEIFQKRHFLEYLSTVASF